MRRSIVTLVDSDSRRGILDKQDYKVEKIIMIHMSLTIAYMPLVWP